MERKCLKLCARKKFKFFFENHALTYSDEYNSVGIKKYKKFIKSSKNHALTYICQYNTM